MKRASYIFLIVLMLAACGGWRDGQRLLDRADSLLYGQPDSALRLLDSITEDDQERMSEAQLMRYHLLRADAQNKCFVPFTTDSVMKEVAHYYERKGTPNEQMRAYYLLGRAYYDMGETPMALKYFHEAADCADTTQTDCDFKLLSRVHGQMGRLLLSHGAPKNSLNELQVASRYAAKGQDTLLAVSCVDFMGSAYEKMNELDSAVAFAMRASSLYRQYGFHARAAMSAGAVIDILIDRGQIVEAKRFIDEYRQHSGLFDKNQNIKPGKEAFYYTEGKYFLSVGSLDSAKYFFRKLKLSARRLNDLEGAYHGLSQVYGRLGLPDSALSYSFKAYSYNDSCYREKASEDFTRNNSLYNYTRFQQLAERKTEEAARNRLIWILTITVLFISLLIFSLVVLTLKNRRKTALLEQYALRNKVNALDSIRRSLEKEKESLLTIRKELSDLLSEKEKQLVKSSKEYGNLKSEYQDTIKSKEQVIKHLEQQISSLKSQVGEKEITNMDRGIFEMKTESVLVKRLVGKGTPLMTESEWKEFKNSVDRIIPNFPVFLSKTCPQLRPIERKIIYLIRTSFSTSEISLLTGRPESTISTLKRRLLSKIFGENGGAKDFESLILHIY